MAEKVSPTLRVLQEIRDEVKKTNERLDAHIVRTDARFGEVDARFERLEREVHEAGVRVTTELVTVAHAVGEVRDLLRDRLDQRSVLEDHEARLRRLETKVG